MISISQLRSLLTFDPISNWAFDGYSKVISTVVPVPVCCTVF